MNEKELSFGTLYDMNKALLSNQEPLSQIEFTTIKLPKVKAYFEEHKEYFMMLCHELRDYTIFELTGIGKHARNNSIERALNGFCDVCENRGQVIDLDLNEDKVIETWIRINGENYAYFLFPYDEGIIKC